MAWHEEINDFWEEQEHKLLVAIRYPPSCSVDEWKYHAVKMVPRLARGHGWPVDRTGSILPTGFRERVSILHTSLSIHLDGNVALALLVFGNLISGPMERFFEEAGEVASMALYPVF